MGTLSFARVAALGAVAGVSMAAGIMAAVAARAIYTITRGGRWYQLRRL